jgi:glutamate dehydrogenase (NAD(P)+)
MGNVGGVAAKLLTREEAKIIAVSDVSGGIYNKNGLDIPSILLYLSKKEGNLLKDYNEEWMTHITNGELLALECTVLIPAALENQINEVNADQIKAKIIVEAANGPTTVEADEILNKKGVTIVPDILANAGGVVVSYFEWVQNIQSLYWSEEEINEKLKQIMDKSFEAVMKISEEKGTLPHSLRT